MSDKNWPEVYEVVYKALMEANSNFQTWWASESGELLEAIPSYWDDLTPDEQSRFQQVVDTPVVLQAVEKAKKAYYEMALDETTPLLNLALECEDRNLLMAMTDPEQWARENP